MAKVTVKDTCKFCKKLHTVEIENENGYNRWIAGELIQRALPDLDIYEREFLITGVCPDCSKALLDGEEEWQQ